LLSRTTPGGAAAKPFAGRRIFDSFPFFNDEKGGPRVLREPDLGSHRGQKRLFEDGVGQIHVRKKQKSTPEIRKTNRAPIRSPCDAGGGDD